LSYKDRDDDEECDIWVNVWSLATGEIERTLENPFIDRWGGDYVKTLLVTQLSNGNLAFQIRPSTSNRGRIVIWSLESEHSLRMIKCRHCKCFLALPNYLLAAGNNRDGSIDIWNTNTGELVNKMLQTDVIGLPKYSSLVSLNESTMASHSVDSISIWSLTTGERLRTFTGPGTSMCLGPNGVLASCDDSKVTLWNWQTGQIIQTLHTLNNISSFAFLKKSNFFLTSDCDYVCRIFVWRIKF
jgi:WD40 repeat protein